MFNQLAPTLALLTVISSTSGFYVPDLPPLQRLYFFVNCIAQERARTRTFTYALSHGLSMPVLSSLLGRIAPTEKTSRRLCKILRAESWRQIRIFRLHIKATCARHLVPNASSLMYAFFIDTAENLGERLWRLSFASLPRNRRKSPSVASTGHINVSDVELPQEVRSILDKGPKFATQPCCKPSKLLSFVHDVARRVPEDVKNACIVEGIKCVNKHPMRRPRGENVKNVVKFLKDQKLTLQLSDKTGRFVVMAADRHLVKAREAVEKNFSIVDLDGASLQNVHKKAVSLCKRLGLQKLEKDLKGCNGTTLRPFFTTKTHKQDNPFRMIVEDKGTWQHILARFLKGMLELIAVEDPFGVSNSNGVIEFLKKGQSVTCISIDVKDMYYNIPQTEAITTVQECIDTYGVVRFQNECGISVRSFLDLLRLYLQSLYVEFNGSIFVQNDGICIGSCLAPILSNLYMAKGDRELQPRLQGYGVVACFRYVDDFLLCFPRSKCANIKPEVFVAMFKTTFRGLDFTYELPTSSGIKFLDIMISQGEGHMCWEYDVRGDKSLLSYSSGHSKLVKRSVAYACMLNSCQKSCDHMVARSLMKQIDRLRDSDYPDALITALAERLLKTIGSTHNTNVGIKEKPEERPIVMPYVHGISHGLKKIASRHGIPMTFTAPHKLISLCHQVNSGNQGNNHICSVRHVNKFVPCETNVVYGTPLPCGNWYVGQTGRCLNSRLREHDYNCKQISHPSNLATHCMKCHCKPNFEKTIVLSRSEDKREREIIEAFMMRRFGEDRCVSVPSIHLSNNEYTFLRRHFR